MIEIELREIDELCDKNDLRSVERDMTETDIAHYDHHGWKYYSKEDFVDYFLPVLGEPVHLRNWSNFVVEFGEGPHRRRWKINIDSDDNSQPYEANGKRLIFTETTEPLSVSNTTDKSRGLHIFSQPVFIQGKKYPAHNSKPCYPLVTVENSWGDNGNWNIFIVLDDNWLPVAGYFEASCH